VSSAAQDQWAEMAAAVRAHLSKMCELLPAMKPEEVATFVKTLDDAQWLEVKSLAYDESVEERRRTLERSSLYGS
jgi:hypothetical protein